MTGGIPMTKQSGKSRVGQRRAGGMAGKALLTAVLTLGLLVFPATTANAAPIADLLPTMIKFDHTSVVDGQQVYFDSGIQNAGDAGTGVFNIKWLVDGQE